MDMTREPIRYSKERACPMRLTLLLNKGILTFLWRQSTTMRGGVKTDVTVAMYSFARFLDIKEAEERKENVPVSHLAWIITNTKFTTKAISYGECKGLKMTGWHYPAKASLESLVEEKMLYPVTVIPSLDRFGKEQFANAGVMFAKDVALFQPAEMQRKFGISSPLANKIREEARILCAA